MLQPRRIDGSIISVLHTPDGRVFVDPYQEISRFGVYVSRGGPDHSRHFCRFLDYGLADGLLRCWKCGVIKEQALASEGIDAKAT